VLARNSAIRRRSHSEHSMEERSELFSTKTILLPGKARYLQSIFLIRIAKTRIRPKPQKPRYSLNLTSPVVLCSGHSRAGRSGSPERCIFLVCAYPLHLILYFLVWGHVNRPDLPLVLLTPHRWRHSASKRLDQTSVRVANCVSTMPDGS
jgi:hypothetical protein